MFWIDFSAFFFCSSSLVLMGTGYDGGVVAVQCSMALMVVVVVFW